jgi:hypothetical protein
VIIRRLIVPLTMAVFAVQGLQANAQGAFPAPLPGAAAPATDSAFPPVDGKNPRPMIGAPAAPAAFPSNGAAPVTGGFSQPGGPQQAGPPGGEACMNEFKPLRTEAEKRGAMIKAASERRAPPDEACKLLKNFAESELKMIKFIVAHQQKCGIPPQVAEQMKNARKTNTEPMVNKVCAAAQQVQQRGPAGPSLSDVLGSSTAVPEATSAKKSGGSTFDTLNGNVLTR